MPNLSKLAVVTTREDGATQTFKFKPQSPMASSTNVNTLLHSIVDIPDEPHLKVDVIYSDATGGIQKFPLEFIEHADHHGHGHGGHTAHDETFPVTVSCIFLVL